MRVKLPRLLSSSMKERARLHPLACEISPLMDPPSTASMTLPRTDPEITIRDWVEMFTKDGSAGIFRVTSVETSYDGETVYVSLEHGICALGDAILPGEGTLEGSLDDLLPGLLSHQVTKANGAALWALGSTVQTDEVRREYNNPNLLTVLTALLHQAGDVMLRYDQTSLPWKVHLEALSDADACEGRFGRNLQSITVSIDDTDMCTRVYVDGEDGYRDADTVSQYGVIARVLNVSEYAEEESAERYISDYLENHKNPNVSIELDVLDMSEATGESIDSMRLGRMCRACLPDYGVTVRNRIIGLRYPDVYGSPNDVRVSMGQKTKDLADLLIEEQTVSASTSSTVSRHYGSSSTRITNAEIELYKSNLALVQLESTTFERFSEVYVDLDEVNAELVLKASQIDFNKSLERISSAEIRLSGAEAEIELKVNKDGVISAINVSSESVLIKSGRINLSGYVTASQLEAELADFDLALADFFKTHTLYAEYANLDYLNLDGSGATWQEQTVVTSVTMPTFTVANLFYVDHDGNKKITPVLTGYSAGSRSTTTITYVGD